MTEHERDWHQEHKDDRAQGLDREPEPPDEQDDPLDLDTIEATLADAHNESYVPAATAAVIAAVPHLLARLRGAEETMADWRSREHRYEYSRTRGPAPSPTSPPLMVNREDAEQCWERPGLGVPWVRTVTVSTWGPHEPSPF